jgi:hypothetical protein
MINKLNDLKEITKSYAQSRLLYIEFGGFLLAIIFSAIDEFYLLPFKIHQSVIETFCILLFGSLTMYLTWQLVKKIKYLEGYMLICAVCKQVKISGNWVSIEEVISNKSDLHFSHGFCPSCARELLQRNSEQ